MLRRRMSIQRDPVRDLVQPGPRMRRILERFVGAVGLDERVLREVRSELRVAEHPGQVREDLGVMAREEFLDEVAGRGPLAVLGHCEIPAEREVGENHVHPVTARSSQARDRWAAHPCDAWFGTMRPGAM